MIKAARAARKRYYPTPNHEFSEKLGRKTRGEGLAPGNRNVYGAPTALLTKSITNSRMPEVRTQLRAVHTKEGCSKMEQLSKGKLCH